MKTETVNTFIKKTLRGAEDSQRELEKRIFHLKTLYDLSQETGYLKGTQEIMKNLLMMIIGTFGALGGLVLLIDTKNGRVEDATQRGIDKTSMDDVLSQVIESGCYKDLKMIRNIQILKGRDKSLKKGKKRFFDLLSSLAINIWVPFVVNEKLRGGIGLKDKLSGDPYTSDDEELLSTLSNQGSVAIENSMLLEQMKKEEIMRANLSRYLSPHVVEQVIKNDMRLNMGGHRKAVTVLFSDIRDFTHISENYPPDKLVQILNEYFTEMGRVIFKHRGSLDKFIGDAIVAVFGSLIQLENPEQNAVETAVEMMKQVTALNEGWQDKYGFEMQIGIGITAGEVFLGTVGAPQRMEFTVIGDTVNVAARLSGIAKGGQILITKEAQSALNSGIITNELPPAELKGKTDKTEIFEVLYK